MPTTLITGANRGIGLAMTKHALEQGDSVVACCRNPDQATELNALAGDIRIERLDVTDPDSCAALSERLGGQPIDTLINNAGVFDHDCDALSSFDVGAFERTIRTNTLGPILVIRALAGQVASSSLKRIANISSDLGSIDNALQDQMGFLGYRVSKAALNMATVTIANELKDRGVTCVTIHPGWVQTDMGGDQAPLEPDTSAKGILSLLSSLTIEDTARYIRYDGAEVAW